MPEAEHDLVRQFFNPPDYVMESLFDLPRGTFWLKTPKVDWVLVTIIGTPKEVLSFNTEAAHNQHMQAYLASGGVDIQEYRAYLDETTPLPEELAATAQQDPHSDPVPSS
jgi:hypothetical protein